MENAQKKPVASATTGSHESDKFNMMNTSTHNNENCQVNYSSASIKMNRRHRASKSNHNAVVHGNVFDRVNRSISRPLIELLVPGGSWKNGEYWVQNPLRADHNVGSFSINEKGWYFDFSSQDKGDFIKLVSRMRNISRREAACLILEKDGQSWREECAKKDKKPPWIRTDGSSLPFFQSKPDYVTRYFNESGELVFLVARWNKGKRIIPHYYSASGFVRGIPGEWNGRRPLYNLSQIISDKHSQILLVEGEKCAHEAEKMLSAKGWIVTTWHGGVNSIHKTDFSPLRGRYVVIWPDNDEPGKKGIRDIISRIVGYL